ncbi:Heat shock protein beta-11 [Chytriomyces hyalinus]|nr:Heat shock protein beta-11 [Chytriomyces hyalinus]
MLDAHVSFEAAPQKTIQNKTRRFANRTTKRFWARTGLFPQEFIVSLPAYYVIKKVSIWSRKGEKSAFCFDVAGWTVSRSTGDAPFDFDEIYREDIEDAGDQSLQVTSFSISSSDSKREYSAKNVKFTIRKGHSDFTAVHRVAITGEIDASRESERKNKKERDLAADEDELSVGRAVRVH